MKRGIRRAADADRFVGCVSGLVALVCLTVACSGPAPQDRCGDSSPGVDVADQGSTPDVTGWDIGGDIPQLDGVWLDVPEVVPDQSSADSEGLEQDLTPVAPVVAINEVVCHGTDFVELVNLAGAPVDLKGWVLSDGLEVDHRYTLPAGSVMEAGGFFVVSRAVGQGPGLPFGLSCGVDTLTLSRPDGTLADEVTLPLVMDGFSLARLPDGNGQWRDGTLTPGVSNLAAPDLDALLFDPLEVHVIDLTMPQESIDALWLDSATYVGGTFTLSSRGDVLGPVDVGLRIKGKYGSFRTLDGKSALKVKFNFLDKQSRFNGLKKLTLNNMVQDPSMIHEVLAYRLFRAMGVPCPRVGYAWMTLNGQPYGLYLVLENYDDVAMSRHFATTQHVYEGQYGNDVVPWAVSGFDMDEGEEGNLADLTLLANASYDAPDGQWSQAVSAYGDVDEWVRMWAVELFTGHWDGYAPTINNYYLHSDESGIFSMLPNGADQTFGGPLNYHEGGGFLFQKCMQDADCRLRYDQALGQLLQALEEADLDGLAVSVSHAIASRAEQDPRKPYSFQDVQGYAQGTREFVAYRWAELQGLVGCWLDPLADLDKDGFRCEQDCDEMDPLSHAGAYDTCADGVDQDCNGKADDAFECPDCQEVWRGPHLYLICPTWRTWDQAKEHCAELGSELVNVNGPEESWWLASAAGLFGVQEAWMSMQDGIEEGVWLEDETGQPVTWFSWAGGQPDNWGDSEDCAEWFAWGEWNDLACWDVNPVICEMPCDPLEDGDGDGALRCNQDCDDGNPMVYPGAEEVCDGFDNDCDGGVDNTPGCYSYVALQVLSAPGQFLLLSAVLTRDEAQNQCKGLSLGSDLAWFDSPEQLSEVVDELALVAGSPEVWIAVNDLVEEGDYRCHDGLPPLFTNWSGGQPNNGAGSTQQDCCRMIVDGSWNDTDCDQAYYALCRKG